MRTDFRHWVTVVVVLAVSLGLLAGARTLNSHRPAVQELTLVARGMSFRLEGSCNENPEIRLRVGGHVRVRFRNEDTGVEHGLTIPEFGLQTGILKAGQEQILDLVPRSPGRFAYHCALHSRMMQGTLVVIR